MLFPLWVLFWLISEADCFYWILMGFCEYPWNDIVLNGKLSSEKKGSIFWCPKIFTVPKKAWCEPARLVRRWRFSSFSLRSPLIGSILCPMKPRHSTKMGWKKGGRKLDFPVGCLFFFSQNRHVVPKISKKRDGKMIFKLRGRGIQGWSTTRIMFGFLLSNTLNTTQTLLSFFDAASANEHVAPPLSCFVLFPFHIPFGLMPATASEKILARLLCWTGNSTRGKSLEILGHFHFPIWVPSSHREIQHKALQSQMSKQTSMHPWQNTVWGSMRRRSGSACAESQKESRMGFRSF